MRDFLLSKVSLLKLFRYFRNDVTTFIRQELALARREMSEKISCYSRHITIIAVGGFVAYAGLIVLLGGLGWLLGFGFEKLGLDPFLSVFIGCAIMAVLTISIGAIAALQGLKAMSNSTLVPEKTVETVKGLKREEP